MNDTQQPDPNQQPQSLTPFVPLSKNKLEDLPIDARLELDTLLKRNVTLNRAKTIIESKWQGKSDVIPAHYATYRAYYDLHKNRLLEERRKELELAQSTAADFKALGEMANSIAGGESVEFKDKYQEILDLIEDRLAFVQDQQIHGFASPQYEAVMVNLAKAKREILEKMEAYKSEVDEQMHEADMAFIENYAYELLLEVYNTVSELYGQDKFSEFKEKLKGKITKVVERAQERFDKDYQSDAK